MKPARVLAIDAGRSLYWSLRVNWGPVLFGLVLLLCIVAMIRSDDMHGECLAGGFVDASEGGGRWYCTRRFEGTDEVVPLSTVRAVQGRPS